MCNLYAIMMARAEAAKLAKALIDRNNNQPPLPGVFPGYMAPVIRAGADGQREMVDVQWGLPTSSEVLFKAASARADKLRVKGKPVEFDELLRLEPDKGTTNVRNTNSRHWKRWLGVENRCLVPFTSFSEPDQVGGTLQPVWYALSEDRPLAFFAGIWVPQWTSVHLVREGPVTRDLFGFLTTEPNAEVARHHAKAMPVILTTPDDCEAWMTAAWDGAKALQRPLPDGTLAIVGRGERQDAGQPVLI